MKMRMFIFWNLTEILSFSLVRNCLGVKMSKRYSYKPISELLKLLDFLLYNDFHKSTWMFKILQILFFCDTSKYYHYPLLDMPYYFNELHESYIVRFCQTLNLSQSHHYIWQVSLALSDNVRSNVMAWGTNEMRQLLQGYTRNPTLISAPHWHKINITNFDQCTFQNTSTGKVIAFSLQVKSTLQSCYEFYKCHIRNISKHIRYILERQHSSIPKKKKWLIMMFQSSANCKIKNNYTKKHDGIKTIKFI